MHGPDYADDCTTPDGEQGQCMPFSSCRTIEERLTEAQKAGQKVPADYASYLQKALCGEFNGVVSPRMKVQYTTLSTLSVFCIMKSNKNPLRKSALNYNELQL